MTVTKVSDGVWKDLIRKEKIARKSYQERWSGLVDTATRPSEDRVRDESDDQRCKAWFPLRQQSAGKESASEPQTVYERYSFPPTGNTVYGFWQADRHVQHVREKDDKLFSVAAKPEHVL